MSLFTWRGAKVEFVPVATHSHGARPSRMDHWETDGSLVSLSCSFPPMAIFACSNCSSGVARWGITKQHALSRLNAAVGDKCEAVRRV